MMCGLLNFNLHKMSKLGKRIKILTVHPTKVAEREREGFG